MNYNEAKALLKKMGVTVPKAVTKDELTTIAKEHGVLVDDTPSKSENIQLLTDILNELKTIKELLTRR